MALALTSVALVIAASMSLSGCGGGSQTADGAVRADSNSGGAIGSGGRNATGGNSGSGGAGATTGTGGAVGGTGGVTEGTGGMVSSSGGRSGSGGAAAGGRGGTTGSGGTTASGGAAGAANPGGRGGNATGGAATGGGGGTVPGSGGVAGGGGKTGAGGGTGCTGTTGCASTEYCDFGNNLCGTAAITTGVCRARPAACGAVVAPTCACDHQVYSNPCLASSSGQDAADNGGCPAPTGRFACGAAFCAKATEYCRATLGGALGVSQPGQYQCMAFPASCTTTPTCACLQATTCSVSGDGDVRVTIQAP